MSPFAKPARHVVLALSIALGAGLAACGTGGGLSTDLPPGKPTEAGPGNVVLYVAMAHGDRIAAFRLGTDGLLPSKPFSTIYVNNPRRLALGDGVLYATLADRVIAMKLGTDGSLPDNPSSTTVGRADYDPEDVIYKDGVLYVAATGLQRVQSFRLEADGDLPLDPTGVGENSQFTADYSSLAIRGNQLYSGARLSQYIDLFTLKADGDVPLLAELQNPQDTIALPDDIETRDNVLYVTSGADRCIRAYKIQKDGYLPGDYNSRTATEEYYASLLLNGNLMYTTAYNVGRIDVYNVNPDGMLPEVAPFLKTYADPGAYPSRMILNDGILYVAQGGLNRIDAYVLDSNGLPPEYPTSSTKPQSDDDFPIDMVARELP